MGRMSLVACACATLLFACGQSDKKAGNDTPATVSAVASTTGAFHETLRTNNLAGFTSFLDQTAVISPPGEPVLRGKDNIIRWYRNFLAKYRTSSLQLTDKEIFVGRDWAVEFGRFSWELSPTDGTAPVLDQGSYMQVWKRQATGSWRFAREVWNSSPPLPSNQKQK